MIIRQTRKIKKMLSVGIAWMVIGVLQEIYTFVVLKEYEVLPLEYGFVSNLVILIIALFISGIMGGYVISFLLEDWLRNKPFKTVLTYIFILYTFVFFLSAFTGTYISASSSDSLTHGDSILSNALKEAVGIQYIRHYFFWLVVTLGTMVFFQISDKYGPGGIRSLLMGKYFRPKPDDRIFLFLDLRSSTSIAEKLGEEKYFRFIRQCYRDMTNCILDNQGEIYQYVGDEIVVSWPSQTGLKNAQCISCYFDIKRMLGSQEDLYLELFQQAPVFKAGLHIGRVTAGEIGVIKKDIAYSGDVLNTAARIQGACNQFNLEILLSKDLVEKLPVMKDFMIKSMGEIELRGKSDKIEVFTLTELG
jgi:adenylate cyclase